MPEFMQKFSASLPEFHKNDGLFSNVDEEQIA